MRPALIQMNSRAAARDENVERACAFVDEATRQHPDIVTTRALSMTRMAFHFPLLNRR